MAERVEKAEAEVERLNKIGKDWAFEAGEQKERAEKAEFALENSKHIIDLLHEANKNLVARVKELEGEKAISLRATKCGHH